MGASGWGAWVVFAASRAARAVHPLIAVTAVRHGIVVYTSSADEHVGLDAMVEVVVVPIA